MNPPPMATELSPLRPASGKRASFSWISWRTTATAVGCVAIAGVSAYASGFVPASSLGMARLGSDDTLVEFESTTADVEGADLEHADPEPAHSELDSPGFTDIVYPDDALGYLRSIVDVSPCFVVCATKENPESLITAAFENNESTCDDINAALANSVCLAEECMDDCAQREYHTKIASDACGGDVDVEVLKLPAYANDVLDYVAEQCPDSVEAKDGAAAVSGEAASGATLGSLASAADLPAPHRVARARIIEAKRARVAAASSPDRDVEASLGQTGPDFHVWPGYAPSMSTIPETPPAKTVAAGTNPSSTFTLFTQCKTQEVKYLNPDFWFSPLVNAYIVKHNYGTDDMFSLDGAIGMTRKELSDGVYGYEATTDQVDWEYGYALQNKRGEVWYEIGANPAPLYAENCTQMYGSYYNRIAPNDAMKSSLFGSCLNACPEDYRDSAFCRKPLTEAISATAPLDLGACDDARLVVFGSAVLFGQTAVIDPSGRSECLRDSTFTDDDAEARWTCGTVDYDRSKIKMVGLKVERRSDGSCYATQTYARAHTFSSSGASEYEYDFDDATHTHGGQCRNAACAASKYPLGPIAQGSPDLAGLGATRLEYVTLSFGDAPPVNKFLNLNDRFLPDTSGGRVVHRYGANEDLDARRIIPKNAAMCGGAINYANCFMSGKAYVDESFTPTKQEKRWIFVIVEHVYFKMIRLSVTLDGRDVRMRAMDAGYISHIRNANDIDTSDSMAYDVTERYRRRNFMPVADCFAHLCPRGLSPYGYGIGAIKFDIASEMSLSLRGVEC